MVEFQPPLKNIIRQIGFIFPKYSRGQNKKYVKPPAIWNHHLEDFLPVSRHKKGCGNQKKKSLTCSSLPERIRKQRQCLRRFIVMSCRPDLDCQARSSFNKNNQCKLPIASMGLVYLPCRSTPVFKTVFTKRLFYSANDCFPYPAASTPAIFFKNVCYVQLWPWFGSVKAASTCPRGSCLYFMRNWFKNESSAVNGREFAWKRSERRF